MVGKYTCVIKAENPSQIGMKGLIVDESRNTVTMQTQKGLKRLPKKGTSFEINGKKVEGALI